MTAQSDQIPADLAPRRTDWLGDLPRRVSLPPMPMQEIVQLARALAEKQGRRITDVEDWRPAHFTKGNPLTITVLVGQALRDGIETSTQVNTYVQKLRNGEAAFTTKPAKDARNPWALALLRLRQPSAKMSAKFWRFCTSFKDLWMWMF